MSLFSSALFPSALLLASMLMPPIAMAQIEPSGAWLDGTTNWNQAGATLPKPPRQDGNNLPNCQQSVRPATTAEDKQLEAAGWTLTGATQIYGATTIVTGMANADGMCRPLSYQVFVFTNGVFTGTLSPTPMDSRTDGSVSDVNLYREGYIGASFNRYTPEDALCCPSRESSIFYEVKTEASTPVLVPQLPAETSSNRETQ